METPPAVRAIAGGRPVRAVWRNERGGLTFRVGSEPRAQFVKWSPGGFPLAPEVERLRWAGRYASVPRVLDHGSDSTGDWMVTA